MIKYFSVFETYLHRVYVQSLRIYKFCKTSSFALVTSVSLTSQPLSCTLTPINCLLFWFLPWFLSLLDTELTHTQNSQNTLLWLLLNKIFLRILHAVVLLVHLFLSCSIPMNDYNLSIHLLMGIYIVLSFQW